MLLAHNFPRQNAFGAFRSNELRIAGEKASHHPGIAPEARPGSCNRRHLCQCSTDTRQTRRLRSVAGHKAHGARSREKLAQ